MDEQHYSTRKADPSHVKDTVLKDTVLNEAGVAPLKKKFPIATELLLGQRLRLIYRVDLAVLLARNCTSGAFQLDGRADS